MSKPSKRQLPNSNQPSPKKRKMTQTGPKKKKKTSNMNLTPIGKEFNPKYEYGKKGKEFGHSTTKTPRKQRANFNVFEKLHTIMYAKKWALAIAVIWKWGIIRREV